MFWNIVFTRFFPMSWTSPYTVPNTSFPLLTPSFLTRYFSSSETAAFMHSADFNTNGSMSSPAPNMSPTVFMAGSSDPFSVAMAASCVWWGSMSMEAVRPSSRMAGFSMLSAMASTTSRSMPSFSWFMIR